MKHAVWVGLGVVIGIGIGWVIKIVFEEDIPRHLIFKRSEQKGDFALRDTERALSRADF